MTQYCIPRRARRRRQTSTLHDYDVICPGVPVMF